MPSVTLSNLQIDENPIRIGGSPNVISMKVDIIINTNEKSDQQFFYEAKNSENEIIAMQIHPQDHKIKPNTKVTIGIPQVFRTVDGYYLLNAWSVSTWTGRRFDWASHTGIKEWNRSSNVASISEKVSRIGTGFQRGQAYQAPAEPTVVSGVKPFEKPERVSVFQPAITEPAAVTITEPLLPEISFLPEAHAEHVTPEPVDVWPTLSQETKTIINDFPANLKAPDWALTYISNNINWLLEGKITETVFLTGYYDYVKKGTIILIDEPEPIVDHYTTNMIRQELLNFTIVNNRIQGSIKFTATDAFNPYFYNKPIVNYLQLKSTDLPNWTQISTTNPKSNPLRFTETERDEVITFDEDAQNLTFVSAESFIEPAMSEVLRFTIEAGKEPTVAGKSGLMGAGVLGLIGILMLGGFIADHVRKRR